MTQWFKKGLLKKYPSTLYISLNKRKCSEVNSVPKCNQQELITKSNFSSQNEINSNSISSSPETYQVKI